MTKDQNTDRMGARVKARLIELGWQQVDLLKAVSQLRSNEDADHPLTDKTLSALITRNGITCEWSDEIAEALGVNHRWLQRGVGPRLREATLSWPFHRWFTATDIRGLPEMEQGRIIGYIERTLDEHRRVNDKSHAGSADQIGPSRAA